MKKAIFLIVIVLLLDQFSKIWMKTHFVLGEEFKVLGLDWFRIHFLENNGMAWGTEFGGKNGKLFLTSFRLVAIFGIGLLYLYIYILLFRSGCLLPISFKFEFNFEISPKGRIPLTSQ